MHNPLKFGRFLFIKVARALASSPLFYTNSRKVQAYYSCITVRFANTTHFKRQPSTQSDHFKVAKTSSIQQKIINKIFYLMQATTAEIIP